MLKLLRNVKLIRSYCANNTLFHIREPQVFTVAQSLKEIPSQKLIVVRGWLTSIRKHKNATFFHIKDGTCQTELQIVALHEVPLTDLNYGCSVDVKGYIVKSPFEKQDVELKLEEIKLIGRCDPMDFPFKSNKEHDADYKRQYQHLRHRNKLDTSILRIRHNAFNEARKYFSNEGFIEVNTPIITTNDSEGAGEVFKVEEVNLATDSFFGQDTFLTVSGQLHLEALCHAISKVYCLSPTFRADHSKTRHHLAEFYMLEAEMAFCNDLDEVEEVIEDFLSETVNNLLDNHLFDLEYIWKNSEIEDLRKTVDSFAKDSYETLTYTEAIEILEKHRKSFNVNPKWGDDLKKEHEKFLVSHVNNCPLFIKNYPSSLKPFYMKRSIDGRVVENVDLLYPNVGEICGGSVREESIEKLQENMQKCGLKNTTAFDWYIDIRKYGTVPHSGFGIGYDRFIQAITGMKNIKDVVPFPRVYGQCKM